MAVADKCRIHRYKSTQLTSRWTTRYCTSCNANLTPAYLIWDCMNWLVRYVQLKLSIHMVQKLAALKVNATKTLWQPTDISTISLVSQQIMGPQFQSVQFSNLSYVACHFFSVDVTWNCSKQCTVLVWLDSLKEAALYRTESDCWL